MRSMVALTMAFVAALAPPVAAPAAETAPAASSIFDPPLSVKRLALPRSRTAPTDKNELSCFSFSEVRVKQLDTGEVGAELAILPLKPGAKPPACQKAKSAGEIVTPGREWSGYFKGVKGHYVLFDADDGVNGGLGFAVFDGHDGRKLFDDVAVGDIAAAQVDAEGLTLRYRRAAAGECSVPKDGAACWAKIAAALPGIDPAAPPDCAAGYLKAKEAMARARCEAQDDKSEPCFGRQMKLLDEQRWDEAPSVIGYDAEARISAAAQTIWPTGGDLSCWPSD